MHAFVRYINPVILAHALVHCRWDEMSGIFERAVWQPYLPDMSTMMRLPWKRPLPSNCALNIQQLWASTGRMC